MKNATLRQLRVVEDAARHLSLTRAAEELHLTPPAVSIQIRHLEGHAHAELFERVGKRLRLTQAGEEVLARVREILVQIRSAEEAIEGLGSLEQGLLDVAVINAGDYFFPWIIAAFRSRHPGIRVRLSVGNREELLARLAAHAVVHVKGFPVMRQWYVVHRRDRSLPRITEAFQRFVVKEGAGLIRKHEKASA